MPTYQITALIKRVGKTSGGNRRSGSAKETVFYQTAGSAFQAETALEKCKQKHFGYKRHGGNSKECNKIWT